MRTDVVTLFPAELEVGDSVFDPTSHRWHEITGIGSGDGVLLLATRDGGRLALAAWQRHDGLLAEEHHDVVVEHQRPRDDLEQVTQQFWD